MEGINGFTDDYTVERINDLPENRVQL